MWSRDSRLPRLVREANDSAGDGATITSPADAISNVDNPLQITPFAGNVQNLKP